MMCIKILVANPNSLNYVDAIEKCGAIPITTNSDDDILNADGLLLCGGGDIHPQYYGEDIDGSVKIDEERDKNEFLLVERFLQTGKPIMGICRGYQLLNIYFGGSLYQHMENAAVHKGKGCDLVHDVKLVGDSFVRDLYGDVFPVNSAHHQAIKKLGKHLKVTMVSVDDSVIEGMEHESLPIFGVQWHPERMCFKKSRDDTVDGSLLIKYFIEMCEKWKERL